MFRTAAAAVGTSIRGAGSQSASLWFSRTAPDPRPTLHRSQHPRPHRIIQKPSHLPRRTTQNQQTRLRGTGRSTRQRIPELDLRQRLPHALQPHHPRRQEGEVLSNRKGGAEGGSAVLATHEFRRSLAQSSGPTSALPGKSISINHQEQRGSPRSRPNSGPSCPGRECVLAAVTAVRAELPGRRAVRSRSIKPQQSQKHRHP